MSLEWNLLIALICAVAVEGYENDKSIHSGKPVRPEQFPSIVYIYGQMTDTKYIPLCSGTIASLNFILTAAHCCTGTGKKVVITGAQIQDILGGKKRKHRFFNLEDLHVYEITEQHIHPDFQKKLDTIIHDVCVLKLKHPLNETQDGFRVAPISYNRLYARKCISIGYEAPGGPFKNPLYYKLVYAEVTWRGHWLIRLYFHTDCGGDSGSPLLCGGKVFGVGSFSTVKHCNSIGQDHYAYLHEERNFLELFISDSNIITANRLCIAFTAILILYYNSSNTL